MGSPISVVIAEITMQKIEKLILENSPVEIQLWKRYVDDIIAIIPNNSQDTLIVYLNSINSNIKFTFEIENNQKLPYLDILIIKNSDGSLKFDIYRKPSYTRKLLDYNSSSHLSHKRSTVTSLLDRAYKICSPEYLQNESKNN